MDRLVTIHIGPPWQVVLHRARLEAEGIQVFIPDAFTKIMNPFVTGANPLLSQLQVPADVVVRAKEILTLRAEDEEDPVDLVALALSTAPDESLGAEPDSGDGPEEPGEDSDEDAWTREELELLATRTRWSALQAITFPFALFYGGSYLSHVNESRMRASWHGLTVFAIGIAVLHMAGTIVFLWIVATGT